VVLDLKLNTQETMPSGNIYHNIRTEGNARVHFGDNYFGEDSEDARTVLWLSHNIDPWARHRATYHKYHSGTLTWFMDDAKVTTWVAADARCEDSARVLWCFGDMGTGKTTTTSRLAEQLRYSSSQHCQIAVVYCNHADSSYLTVQHILGLILAQIYSTIGNGAMSIPDNVKQAYRRHGHLGPALTELEGWLREAHLGTCAPLTLFLDGLDELRSSIRSGVLHALRPSSLPGIKLFMTSRFLPDEFESGEESFAHTSIEFSSAEADIRNLILSSLESPAAYRLIGLSKRVQARKTHRVDVVHEITSRIMAKTDT
jgi:hypothetical protein